MGVRVKTLVSAVEQRAFLEAAAHIAVSNGDKLGRFGPAQCITTLQADAVIPRRVDIAVRDAHVAAAIDIHAVAVGVDAQVVDGKVIDAGGEYAEVAAVENGEIAQNHVVAVLQSDGLVAHSWVFGNRSRPVSLAESLAPDESGAEDGDVMNSLAPEQAVVPMGVAVVLVVGPVVGLRQVIAAALSRRGGIGRHDGRTLVEI